MKHGTPYLDTFCKVFAAIDHSFFSECFSRWAAIHMVSAWACSNRLVLAQQKVDDTSNEITTIPKLLIQLNIQGEVVALDAMGCQTKITTQITAQNADYLLSLKGNQGLLHKDVKQFFETETTRPPEAHEEYDGGHGRIETRTIRACADIDWLRAEHPNWPDIYRALSRSRLSANSRARGVSAQPSHLASCFSLRYLVGSDL